ncbi:hypothetical protein HGRIS_013714 [Hohenbuehelia grisea]|uniref:Peptidase A1 domain-containing protein n=1 Tax=Hohenbuehelia grisea TaxID=104357 RepID=A0ABR3IWB5_9AGAR
MRVSAAALLAVLPCLAVGVPHDTRAPTPGRISITKHSALINKDGSLDPRVLQKQIIRAEDKLWQGRQQIQRNSIAQVDETKESKRGIICALDKHHRAQHPHHQSGTVEPSPTSTGQLPHSPPTGTPCSGTAFEPLDARHNAYRRGSRNLIQRHATRLPRADDPATVSSAAPSGASPSSAPGQDPLDNDRGVMWFGKVSVGTPPVEYTVDFDTGSSDFFLPGADCNLNCDSHTKYDPHSSSSASPQNRGFIVGFADGSMAAGDLFADTASIAGFSATNQTVGAASQYSKGFAVDVSPPDGLMGLAFEPLATFEAPNLIQFLADNNQLPEPVFAFKLAAEGSELSIGGTNPALFKGDITFTPVTQQAFWEIKMDSVAVDGNQVLGPADVIIDTGTTLVLGGFDQVAELYKKIPGAQDASSSVGLGAFTFPCNSTSAVSLSFGGKQFPISPDLFILGPLPDGQNCVGSIVGSSVAAGDASWIIGDRFLQNVYTIFDIGNSQVGFAELA